MANSSGASSRLDPFRVAAFLFALARGANVVEAAVGAELASSTLYYWRRRSAPFARAWREAMEMAQAADQAARAADAEAADAEAADAQAADAQAVAGGRRGLVVRRQARDRLVRVRKKQVEFDRERKQAFLDHFAGSCNLEAAARAAGISVSPVYRALAGDPAFADGFAEALAIGYRLLEAEELRQQRAGQAKYRIDPAVDPAGRAESFGRTMQLLGEYHRGLGKIGRRPTDRRLPRVATNAEVSAALETRLKAFYERVRAEEAAGGAADAAGGEPAPRGRSAGIESGP